MANVKISELTALTPPDAADLVPVTDSSASQTKRTTVGEIVGIVNGDVDVANDGTATISELPVSKLQDGSARQLLQTDAAGAGVEWTSNVDVPGTLDVTGATTLDSTLGVTGQSTLASAAVSDLTSGRVVLAGTSGELEDSAGLTFNGTQLDVDGNAVITGNLTVQGTQTIFETETVKVEDKNIELAVVASPTDVTADGGGITLKGSTDKTINWVDATDAWTSSEHVDLASGKSYRINGTEVLSATALGSAVQISSDNIPNGTIVDADINASAEIAVSKLQDGAARQLLQTDAAGTGVEWTSNVDVPGTLDVTGAATFDEHVNLASAKEYRIAGTKVLDATSLGSAVVSSSLTSVGTITTGVWQGTAVDGAYVVPSFGSQNITTTGTSTAGRFETTSNTAPANGIYLAGANTVGIATASTPRARFDAVGNIGIGQTSVTPIFGRTISATGTSGGTLRLAGNTTSAYFFTSDGSGLAGIATETNNPFSISVNSIEKVRVTSTSAEFSEGINLAFGTTTGTKIGTAATQKLGFFNATPVVQPAAIANITTTATTGTLPTADGSVTIADAAAPTVAELLEYCVELEAKLEAALTALRTIGIIAT